MNTFPVLHTERLDLVEIKQAHLNDIYKLFSDEKVTEFYNLHPFKQENDAKPFLDWFRNRFSESLAIRWGIALKGQEKIIGTLGFNNFTANHRANIGYDLQKEFWNNGYITEALEAVIKYGFNQLEFNRIEAEVMLGNNNSERVLEKLGFKKEGVLREWMYWDGNHYDMIMYSLLKNEYKG